MNRVGFTCSVEYGMYTERANGRAARVFHSPIFERSIMFDPAMTGAPMNSGEEDHNAKRAGFWISQLVIIIATVGGVYLAASQGLKQAMQFDNIKSMQNNYYLRTSLRNELSDNVGYMREYVDKVSKRVVKPTLNLETFVWNSMTYSPTSLETPSEILREAQRFYHTAEEIMANPHWNDNNRAKALGELADHMEKEVLPRMEKDAELIAVQLDKLSVRY